MKNITNSEQVTINKEVGTVGEFDAEDVAKLIPEGMKATDVVDEGSPASLEDTFKSADADEE